MVTVLGSGFSGIDPNSVFVRHQISLRAVGVVIFSASDTQLDLGIFFPDEGTALIVCYSIN